MTIDIQFSFNKRLICFNTTYLWPYLVERLQQVVLVLTSLLSLHTCRYQKEVIIDIYWIELTQNRGSIEETYDVFRPSWIKFLFSDACVFIEEAWVSSFMVVEFMSCFVFSSTCCCCKLWVISFIAPVMLNIVSDAPSAVLRRMSITVFALEWDFELPPKARPQAVLKLYELVKIV